MSTSVFMSFPDEDDDAEPVWIVEATGEMIENKDIAGVDWKETPEGVADAINSLLEKHNLVIEVMEDGSDAYWFRVKLINEWDPAS